jgi:UDP-N-acetylglucosamine 2-epimerase (non-hydrolysing)
MKKRLAVILGIRPDVIRASLILNRLRSLEEFDVRFIWSGQHYSDNLKDIFFRELGVAPPDIELGARGATDAEIVAAVIRSLHPVLDEFRPEAAVFLGDTNTVMGCLAAAQLNLPIVHIEGCMRSYDWRMPEEKYRSTIDHLSDVIYTYFDEYRAQGIAEGLNPRNLVIVGNLIVDVLHRYYFDRKASYDALATGAFFRARGLERGQYYLMTCHRRENVERRESLAAVVDLLHQTDRQVFFAASYRTQACLKRFGLQLPPNVRLVDPVGYTEMLLLLVNARAVLTDSGTVVEETAVLQVPSLQMRKATERPQVYDCGSSVKFDPELPDRYPAAEVFAKLEALHGRQWEHRLGDGRASERVVADLAHRLRTDGFHCHRPEHYHLDVSRSYRDDGVETAASVVSRSHGGSHAA